MLKTQNRILTVSMAVLFMGLSQAGWADTYQVIQQTTTSPQTGILKTVTTIQYGTNTLNRFNVVRIRKDVPVQNMIGPVMLLSPYNYDYRWYEVRTGSSYTTSVAGGLAKEGFDVWAVDGRLNPHSGQDCVTGAVDCSVMGTWTLQTRVEDVTYARSLVAAVHTTRKPIIGGFVGGSMDALAVVNAHPNDYIGILGWQGSLYSNDPATKSLNAGFCQFADTLISQGVVFDAGAPSLLIALLAGARLAPDQPADPALVAAIEGALPGFDIPDGLSNHQLLVYIFSNHIPNNPNFPTPNWVVARGNANLDKFFFLDEEQYFQIFDMGALYQVAALPQLRDYVCAIAGTDTTHYVNLGAFQGDLFFMGTSQAMGPLLEDTSSDLMTGADTKIVNNIPGFGELDRYFNHHRQVLADLPIQLWMKAIFLKHYH